MSERGQFSELEPTERCCHRDMSDCQGAVDVEMILQPFIGQIEFERETLGKRHISQIFWAAEGFPAETYARIGQALRHGLELKGLPPCFAIPRYERVLVMDGVEVGADNVGVENSGGFGASENGHLSQWILGKDSIIALGGTCLMMNDVDLTGQTDLVDEDKHLAGLGGVGLIK